MSATAAFVLGVILERHNTHNEAAESAAQRAAGNTTSQPGAPHNDSGEGRA